MAGTLYSSDYLVPDNLVFFCFLRGEITETLFLPGFHAACFVAFPVASAPLCTSHKFQIM